MLETSLPASAAGFRGANYPGGGGPSIADGSSDRQIVPLGVAVLSVVCFLWPAELPLAMFWQGLGHGTSVLVVAGALLAVRGARVPDGSGDWRWFSASCLGYLGVGVAPLIVSAASGVDVRFAYQQLAFGYLAPIVFVAATLSLPVHEQQRLWNAFYFGWVVFLLASLAILVVAWRSAIVWLPAFESVGFAQKLVMWRFTLGEPWNLYGHVMGNANKLSNNLIMFLLMSVTLLTLENANRHRRALLFSFWILGIFTLMVMLSRAAILLLPVVVVASGVPREIPRTPRRLALLLALGGLAGLWFAVPEVFGYLLGAKYLPDAEADPLGTYNDRLAQWSQLLDFLSAHTQEALFGLGTSGYGIRFVGEPNAGTHNTFLDLWSEAGIFSPLLLGATMASIGLQFFVGAKSARRRVVLAAGLGTMLLLMTREHSFSYLFVTSLGGLCLAVLIYVAIAPEPEKMDRCPRETVGDGPEVVGGGREVVGGSAEVAR